MRGLRIRPLHFQKGAMEAAGAHLSMSSLKFVAFHFRAPGEILRDHSRAA